VIEYRTVGGSATADGDVLSGLVTPFNTWTTIGDVKRGGFKEQIAPGSFAKTLQEQDVVLINSHDTAQPMARTSIKSGAGSLVLREDPSAGLRAEAKPVDTSYAKDVMKLARARVVRGMSFGFEVMKDSWTDDEGRASNELAGTKRTIHEVRLHEVTTTAFPAYETTELSARDAINAARGIAEDRAAKASYADMETCGDCGSTGQYGQFCSNCGGSMEAKQSKATGFCTSCGGKMSGKREAHVCDTTRAGVPDPAMAPGASDYSGGGDQSLDVTCASCGNMHSCNSSAMDSPNNGDGSPMGDIDPPMRSTEPGHTTPEDDERHAKDIAIWRSVLNADFV
jgi:HK97 family phage prohead protease